MTDAFGIYIHWPFCRSKCPYCDFFSQVRPHIDQDALVDDYLRELDFYARLTASRKVTSIFFGGGTPSLLSPSNISRLLEHIARRWPLSSEVEISLEANPNTNQPHLFSDLKQAGINRLSLGVQALNDLDLKFLGRTHTLAQALAAAEDVVKTFSNHSLDLIYARPDQTAASWQSELQQAVKLGFKHLSAYQLTIEPNTIFARRGIKPLAEEKALELYRLTNDFLAAEDYPRYEISNYACPAAQCRHNLLYWQGQDYIGIGPAAHGRLHCDDKFYATTHRCQLEELSAAERAEELLLMGLRLVEGIDKTRFAQECGLNFDDLIDQEAKRNFIAQGLLLDSAENFRLTASGFYVMNYILSRLCA